MYENPGRPAAYVSNSLKVGSVAEKIKAPFLRRPWDLCSTPTLIGTLMCPWIMHFTMIISAWWLRTSSKFNGKNLKNQPENSEMDNS